MRLLKDPSQAQQTRNASFLLQCTCCVCNVHSKDQGNSLLQTQGGASAGSHFSFGMVMVPENQQRSLCKYPQSITHLQDSFLQECKVKIIIKQMHMAHARHEQDFYKLTYM